MDANWDYVKATTLWPYEALIEKLQAVLAYPFIRQHYAHTMPEAAAFLQHLSLPADWERSTHSPDVAATFTQLHEVEVQNYADLVAHVATRTQCVDFVAHSGIGFERLINLLNCLLRWNLPFATATRELLNHDNSQEMALYPALKQLRLTAGFAVLEQGRTQAGRMVLTQATDLPEPFLYQLVHRADIARLPYVRRKTILPLCGAGYDTLAKIAAASVPEMEAALDTCFQRTQGKPWKDFKSVIVVRGLIRGAQALPVVVEE